MRFQARGAVNPGSQESQHPTVQLALRYLELGRDLVDEWDELLEVLGFTVFEHVL